MELRLIVVKVNRFLESKVYGFLLNLVDEEILSDNRECILMIFFGWLLLFNDKLKKKLV